jgi:hypothetical protein
VLDFPALNVKWQAVNIVLTQATSMSFAPAAMGVAGFRLNVHPAVAVELSESQGNDATNLVLTAIVEVFQAQNHVTNAMGCGLP